MTLRTERPAFDEQAAARTNMRDVAAVLALPSMWKGRDQPYVARSMLEVLVGLLRPESVRVRILSTGPAPLLDEWRPAGSAAPDLEGAFQPGVEAVEVASATHADGALPRVAFLQRSVLEATWQVAVFSKRESFPTEMERFLLNVVVEQAAIAAEGGILLTREREARRRAESLALENEQLYRDASEQRDAHVQLNSALRDVTEELRAEREALATIERVGRTLSAELDLEKVVQAATDAATTLSGAQFGAFFFNATGDGDQTYQLYTLSGAPRAAFERFPLPRNTPLFEPTLRGSEVVRIDDVRQDPRYGRTPPHHGLPPGHPPVRSYLAVPVISRSGEVLGGLFFGHAEPAVFGDRAERLVRGVAAQAAVAIDNARLYEEVRQAVRTRDEFLSSAAHDLRTPLTSIKGTAQLLRRRAMRGAADLDQLVSALATIDTTATRMTGLLDELSDLTRAQMGQVLSLRRTKVDLSDLASRVAASEQLRSDRHHITVVAPEPVVGDWDEARLERAIHNLIDNAVKYSPSGGAVTVTVSRHRSGGSDQAVLAVRDEGIGIPAGDTRRIFERFERGANAERGYSGTGVGLASARQLVEAHGGTISVESAERVGSTFTIRLPITPSDEQAL